MTTPPPQPPDDPDDEPRDESGSLPRRDDDTEWLPPIRDEEPPIREDETEYRVGRSPSGPEYSPDAGYDGDAGYGDGPSFGDGPRYAGEAEGPEGQESSRRTTTTYIGDPRGPFRRPDISQEDLEGLQVDATGLPMGPRRVLPLEDEPSSLVARYLFPTERYRGEWRRHWVHLSAPIAIAALATLALGYLSGFLVSMNAPGILATIAVVIWLFVVAWAAWRFGDWWFDRFILTNKRVMVVNGIITRNVAMMPLLRVTDMKYEQSPLGRMLNYGTFVLESAGQEQALRTVSHLPNPNELYLRVVEEMYEPQAVEARLGKDPDEVKADDGA
ncbi:PH domain-containing protein [Rhizomonospora bruguierae]|uniref:PH domain-containing protein n=1 Tax=Rhizomonospora bruguierae TaxID=1581705 RepID=UPI001BCA9003|nr:PH domain-containing protein [Micromonospora sp. NBRC 107566]